MTHSARMIIMIRYRLRRWLYSSSALTGASVIRIGRSGRWDAELTAPWCHRPDPAGGCKIVNGAPPAPGGSGRSAPWSDAVADDRAAARPAGHLGQLPRPARRPARPAAHGPGAGSGPARLRRQPAP